ncbi:hypothetical protein QYE76_011423 [Lolium multiflorum]|uniref:Gag-pol polyprotein n=1 Tax=Lolium multiflorum TaxID=4521 RepID=A0AAD8X302_LOLMU|nr:hypothetical protein QYE76_011423 [Lolium multiflorum]
MVYQRNKKAKGDPPLQQQSKRGLQQKSGLQPGPTGPATGQSGVLPVNRSPTGLRARLRSSGQPALTGCPACSVELWEIILHGYREPQDPVRLTSTEFYNRQLNASARDKIRSGINRKLLDQVNDIGSAKELWDRIVVLQEGTDLIQSALYETAKQEAHQFMIREGESVADAYARLGALRVRIKGLGVEKYDDGFEMNEGFIKSKVIAMIAVKQEDTNLALNLQIMTKSADLNSDDLVSYVAANENMAKAGKRLMAMNRVDEASHNHEASHNLALKARADHGGEEEYEIEEDEEMTSTSDIATDFAFFAKKYKGKLPMLLNDKKKKRTCYNCDEESHFANECPYEKRVDKPKFIKGVKPRLKPNPINDRYKRNKGRAFVGAEYLSDEEEEDEEKEAGVAGLAFSKPGSLFTYDYSKDYSTENDVGSSFMARTTQDDDSDDSTSSTIVGSCLMARETKVMEPPPSLSSVLDDEAENQEELTVLKELYNVRCTLRGEALVKFDFLMDSLKEKDESIEELEYHLNDKERRFNLLRQELKTERCISQGLKQQIETYELDKVKDLETIERAQSLTQELNASKEELEVAHASLTRDLDHLERANKLVKDELKKLGKNHDLLQETYSKALESMNDSIVDKDVASSSTTFTSEHAKLVAEHVRLQEELSLHVETNTYLESLVTKYGLNYYPNESACEQATTLEENVRLKKELAKFTTTKNKMGLDDLLSKQRSNNQKYGLGYDPKPYKKNNYKKEKPAQEKNKKVTNDGKAPKGKATSGDRTGPNNHYALFVDYYGDVYANYVGPRNGYAYRGYSIWGYSSGGPKWVFDSGCTNHMTGGRGVLDQFIEDINKKSSITFGDNSKGKVLGYGKVAISKDLCLETVMLVEHLGYNLLSIYHLADAGYNSYFTKYYVQVFRSDNLKLVLVGYVENNLYVVDLSKESPSPSTCLMAAKHDEGWLWHRRLGHVNMRNLKQLLKGEHIVGLTGISFEKDRVCSACVAGKQLKKKHPIKSIVTTSRPLELLHLDLFGPSHYDTLGGSKYGLVIVDDYSRYSWVFLLKSKDETHREFITFAKKAQRTYESEIKAIRTDNGTEFKNYTMQEFVDDEGIKHEFSAPYTPQQNGVVERKNRTIIEMARTMLSEFNSPHNFWGEAISTAVHYSNRLFLRPLHNKTPYELLTGNKPNVMYIRVFGCKCLVKNNKGKLGKFETRTIEGIFVGYAENSHAYRYYNRSTGTIEVSCDVVFLEDNGSQVEQVVPCVAGNDDDPSSAIKHMGIGHIRPMEVHNDDQGDGVEVSSSPQVEPSSTQVEPSSATQDLSSTQDEPHPEEQEESPQPTEQDHDDDQETSSTHVQAQVVPHDQVLARDEFIDHEGTIRKIKAATRASDMKVDQVLGSISKGVVTRRHHALLITYCQHHAFVSSFEPLKVHEALVDPDWVIAMQEELECFTRNEVWSLVERPKDHRINVIGTKWVFKNKQDENGIVIRNKARLVAQGFAQIEDDGGSQKGSREEPLWLRPQAARPKARPRHPCSGGPTAPFASFSRTPSSRKPKPREDLTRVTAALRGRTPERKELSGGQNPPGNSLPEGEIDAIAIVIERDIISIIIIIIIISTIYTAITTAAPRISMNEVRKKLFTISLSGKAAHWYKLLKNGDSIDWEDIVPLFYSKFYPPSEIHKDRNRIYNFWPHDGESIAQAWGRLKSLMLKCPIHELPGNVIIDNFYARLSFQDKTLLDTSCSGSFTRKNEEFKRDLLDRIQENTEGWENDKDRESGIIYDYKCIEVFMDTDKFRNMSATYGLDSQVVANLYKAFASHYELPKKNFDKYHEPYKDKVDSSVNKCVVVETVDNVIPEAYIEKTPFPAKMKEYSVISSAVNKSEKKPKEPEEQIKIEPAVAIVKDLVTENVEDGHIIFCEDASNIVSHPNKSKQVSVPMLSVRIGDHCYYGLCDIGASVSAIPYELYTEIMHEIGSCELEDIDVVIHLANRETISPIGIVRDVEVLCDCKKEKILTRFAGEPYEFNFSKFTKTPYKADLPSNDFKMEQCASIVLVPNNPLQQHLENSESEAFRKERDELEEIFLRQPILKHDLPVEDLGTTPPPKEDPVFDLKPLPDNLKYAHIDDKKIYHVIISSKLSEIEEERLLEILKKHRGAIGYTLDDLKGISPSICQHAINMEDDAKPVVEHQRRLIPKMKEVVRNEVLKLLEAGIIYPIADSRWVSPVHCVPKKGGMTVVPNDNDELIPQRIVVGYRMCIDF